MTNRDAPSTARSGDEPAKVDCTDMTLLAWVGPDEFDGTRGIKGAHTPVGWIPLAFKGEHEDRARSSNLRAQLQNLATEYGTRIQLVRFTYFEVVETLEPD